MALIIDEPIAFPLRKREEEGENSKNSRAIFQNGFHSHTLRGKRWGEGERKE